MLLSSTRDVSGTAGAGSATHTAAACGSVLQDQATGSVVGMAGEACVLCTHLQLQ